MFNCTKFKNQQNKSRATSKNSPSFPVYCASEKTPLRGMYEQHLVESQPTIPDHKNADSTHSVHPATTDRLLSLCLCVDSGKIVVLNFHTRISVPPSAPSMSPSCLSRHRERSPNKYYETWNSLNFPRQLLVSVHATFCYQLMSKYL